MFGRKKNDSTAAQSSAPVVEKQGGKGRPTPTRKEAEQAAKERARGSMDKKKARQVMRESRANSSREIREGMKRGDERYLMARDKGPVKRFIRDWVDTRVSFMEWLLPLLVLIMVLQLTGNPSIQSASNGLWSATVIMLILESAWLIFRLRGELRNRFPDGDTRGWRFYALMRAIQMRFLRMPKPQVKVRQELPNRYR